MSNLVSIITPSYNSSKFIEDCVSSVISQTYINWELLIVDDCSKDNSRDVISELADKDERIKSIFLEKNIGAAPLQSQEIIGAATTSVEGPGNTRHNDDQPRANGQSVTRGHFPQPNTA